MRIEIRGIDAQLSRTSQAERCQLFNDLRCCSDSISAPGGVQASAQGSQPLLQALHYLTILAVSLSRHTIAEYIEILSDGDVDQRGVLFLVSTSARAIC